MASNRTRAVGGIPITKLIRYVLMADAAEILGIAQNTRQMGKQWD